MNDRTELNIQYLVFGAKMKKQVEIQYRYLYKEEKESRRYGSIQPIRWLYGKDGSLHILGWDTEKDNWRRFAVENIERVFVTDIDWTNHELEEALDLLPH